MRQQLSIRQYRRIDLLLFSVILCLCESVIILAGTRWFPGEPYVMSVTGAVCAVVMFRWGSWAGIYAVLGAVLRCALYRWPLRQYAVWGIGNLLCMIALIPMKKFGWRKIRDNTLYCMGFGLLVILLMQTGRALLTLIFTGNAAACLMHYTTDVIPTLFTVVLMWIARRVDGLLEEQRHYVTRIGRETASETESENAGRMKP